MACLVTAKFVCKEGEGKQFLESLVEMLPDTRTRDGFIDLAGHVDQENPDIILAIEHWENRSDHEAYMGWRAERGDVAKLMPFLDGPPEFGYYDILGD